MAARRPSPASSSAATTRLGSWLGIAALIVLLDQITKTLVVGRLRLHDSIPLTDWLNLVRAHNTGAAFSMLADAQGWQRWFFVLVGLAASGFIIWMLRSHPGQRLFCWAVTLILGGALGNVIDRLWHGHVVDFIQVHHRWLEPPFRGGYFPAFNVADAAITLGAIGLIVDEIRRVRRSA